MILTLISKQNEIKVVANTHEMRMKSWIKREIHIRRTRELEAIPFSPSPRSSVEYLNCCCALLSCSFFLSSFMLFKLQAHHTWALSRKTLATAKMRSNAVQLWYVVTRDLLDEFFHSLCVCVCTVHGRYTDRLYPHTLYAASNFNLLTQRERIHRRWLRALIPDLINEYGMFHLFVAQTHSLHVCT